MQAAPTGVERQLLLPAFAPVCLSRCPVALSLPLVFSPFLQGHLGTFCRENPLFPFTFAGVNNFLQVKGYPRRNTLSIKFGFRTWDVVGLLFYTPFSDNLGWLEMVLSDGQINVTIAQPRTKIKKLEFAAGTRRSFIGREAPGGQKIS